MNNDKNTAATTSLVLGIASIVVAVLGGIMFGIFGALIAVILGIIAVVMGTNAKKATNGVKGTGGYTCGLIGLILGVIFAAGCGICGCSEPTGYTCYGCVGGSCKASNDVNNGMSELYDVLNDYDW